MAEVLIALLDIKGYYMYLVQGFRKADLAKFGWAELS